MTDDQAESKADCLSEDIIQQGVGWHVGIPRGNSMNFEHHHEAKFFRQNWDAIACYHSDKSFSPACAASVLTHFVLRGRASRLQLFSFATWYGG
jgi:hypothetical protein